MALPELQKLPSIGIKRTPSPRFSGAVAPQIDKGFLQKAESILDYKAKKEAVKRAEQLDFVKTMADNDAENDVIQANAELAQIDGLNTLDKSTALRDKLQKKFDKRKESIPEQFHPYVDSIFAKKLTRYNKFAVPYTLGQVKKVHDEANKVYLANAINEAIEDSGDIEEFNRESLAKVTYAAGKAATKRFGDDPELVKEAVSRSISESIRRSVEQQAFLGRFDKAGEILTEFNAELTPADRVKSIKLMDRARSEIGDRAASDLASLAIAEGDGDYQKGFDFIKASGQPDKVRRAAEYFFKSEWTVNKKAKEQAIEKTHARINQAIEKGQDPRPIIFELPPGEERDKAINRLNENRGKENILTDWSQYDRLSKRLSGAVSARELPDDLIESFRHVVSPRDIKPLEERFNRLKDVDNKEVLRVNRLAYTMADDELEAFAKANKIRGEKRGILQGAVYDEVDRVLTLGGKPNTSEFRSKIRNTLREKGMTEKVTERWWWFDKKEKVPSTDLSPDSSPTPHRTWVEAIRAARPNYSETQINAAIQELIKANVDVTRPR